MIVPRDAHVEALNRKLRDNPVVALLGARQVGKTTLARELAARRQDVSHFDLEDPRDVAKLDEPTLALEPLRGGEDSPALGLHEMMNAARSGGGTSFGPLSSVICPASGSPCRRACSTTSG